MPICKIKNSVFQLLFLTVTHQSKAVFSSSRRLRKVDDKNIDRLSISIRLKHVGSVISIFFCSLGYFGVSVAHTVAEQSVSSDVLL